MSITRRHLLAALTASTLLAMPGVAQAVETVRIGLPTKTYWPTTIAETAVRQKLFEKEGIAAELTIYRGGAETFEAMAAGAADVILDATSLPAAGRKKGVMSKVVANAAMGSFGWQLMVLAKSTLALDKSSLALLLPCESTHSTEPGPSSCSSQPCSLITRLSGL